MSDRWQTLCWAILAVAVASIAFAGVSCEKQRYAENRAGRVAYEIRVSWTGPASAAPDTLLLK